MNKRELVTAVSIKTGFTKKDSEKFIEDFKEVIIETLERDEKVQLTGFGVFENKKRASKKGRNPSTGETMVHPARKAPFLTFSDLVKDRVNK